MIGVLLVGHGSRRKEGNTVYEKIAEIVKEKTGFTVEVGYMKHGKSIKDAYNSLAKKGVKKIIVVPLFLIPGLHVTEDIPIILGLKAGNIEPSEKIIPKKDVKIIYTEPIGTDFRLADIVVDKVYRHIGGNYEK